MEEMNICTVVVGTCTYKQVVEEKGICMASWVVVVVEAGSRFLLEWKHTVQKKP